MTTRKSSIPRADAIAHLRRILPPGSFVYTTLNHVSRSGMLRCITLHAIVPDEPHPVWLNGYAAAVLDERLDEDHHEGIRVGGAGMDMGFHLVYSLSRALYPDGFTCSGDRQDGPPSERLRCPSNDHSNGLREYGPSIHHRDGGYALSHRWL